jgi:hypothetical protein
MADSMRPTVVLVLLSARVVWAFPASGEDDPKLERGAEPEAWALVGAEDPKLERGPAQHVRYRWQDHFTPRFQLAYRRLTVHPVENVDMTFNTFELDYYAFSSLLRLGMGLEIGISGNTFGAWYFTAGPALGLQYPWRVTPFIEGRFKAGYIGGSFMGQTAVTYIYVGGIEAGIELYLVHRLHLTASLGWAHPVFQFIDLEFTRQNPLLAPQFIKLSNDTYTFKIGLGF